MAGEEAATTIFSTVTSNPFNSNDNKSRTDDDAVDRSKKRWSEADGEDGGRSKRSCAELTG